MYDDRLNGRPVSDATPHHPDHYSTSGFSAALLGDHHGAVPFGTKVQLSYRGRKVVVVVNDIGKGETGQDRVLDLSNAAMSHLMGRPVSNATAGLLGLDSIRIVGRTTPSGPAK